MIAIAFVLVLHLQTTLIDDLDASYDQVLWIIDGYMLVFSVLLITTGRLGDTAST
ncbi:hypothetical protein [Streptomyces chartreusis]